MVALDSGHTTNVIEIVSQIENYLTNFNIEILKSFREDLQASLEMIRECEEDDTKCLHCITLVDVAIKFKQREPIDDPTKIVLMVNPEN